MAETTIYEGNGLHVTTARVRVGSTMYPVAAITSVTRAGAPGSPSAANVVVVLGILIALAGAFVTVKAVPEARSAGLCILVVAALTTLAGVWGRSRVRGTWTVTFATATAKVTALTSHDESEAGRALAALEDAVAGRAAG